MAFNAHTPMTILRLLFFVISPSLADFNTVKSSCSQPCQLTVDACKQLAQENQPSLTDNCALISANIHGVSAYQCLVKNGFCTVNEFIKLKNEACGQFKAQETVSTATTVLYQALSATTNMCQRKGLTCILGSSVATVLKQQQHYCDLLNISTDVSSSQLCLNTFGCSDKEFDRLKTAACSSSAVTDDALARAIMKTSARCKGVIDSCTGSNENVLTLIQSEQYCKVMNIDDMDKYGTTAYTCLVKNTGCTHDEFDKLKTSACGNVPGYDSLSKLCQMTVDNCQYQAQYIYPALTDTCTLLKKTFNEVTAYQCLVKIGFCTENEYIAIKNQACDETASNVALSMAKTSLYNAMSATSDACQKGALSCIQQSGVATVLKQQERYCSLMYINTSISNSEQCLISSGCLPSEFNNIRNAACSSSTVTEGTFANAIFSSSTTCKGAMETCIGSSDTALALIQSEQYCKVMSIQNNGVTTYSCLVDTTKCSQAEFDALKLSACGVIPGYASVSKLCQITVDSCRYQALFVSPELTDTCKLLKSTFNGVTAIQCLVNIGFCTESEYSSLVKDSCGSSDDQKTASGAKTSLYNTLSSTAESCQRSALLCIQGSSVATVMKQQENYCSLLNIFNDFSDSKKCLTTSGCSTEEFNKIKSIACASSSTVGEGTFATTVMGSTSKCKWAMETCTSSSDTALALIQSEDYCKVMNINNNGATTETCLVADSRCTKSEFDSLKHAACTGVSVYANCLLLLISIYAAFL